MCFVKELKGPFDFIFSDADKDWYKNYFIDVDPKLKVGGCFTSHNISDRSMGGRGGSQGAYLDYLKSLKNYETTVNTNGGGMAITVSRKSSASNITSSRRNILQRKLKLFPANQ